ncbi:MAG: radical SAM protein [Nitrospiraceae bacterium]
MVPIEYKDFSRTIHENAAAQDRVIKAQLELTYRCNLHCLHCYTDPYNTKEFFPRELTLAETTRLIDEMVDLGIIWLNLTGGEIFTHPHFFEIYEYAHRRGLLLMLYTNGTLFTQGIIERLRQSPPFSIDVSVHSVDPEAFDRFTQVHGSFRTFIKGMELLKNSGLPFCFKTKAMNWNKDELPEIERFVTSFGQQFGYTTSLSPRLNGNLSSLAYRLTPSEIGDIETPHVSANNDGEACCVSDALGPAQNDRLFRCGCATNQIHINAWGALGTCTLQYERRVSLREHALKEAVDKLFRDVRALRYEGDSPCRHCAIHRFCDKKPSDANWERGHPEAPIPYDCDVAWTRAQRIFGQTLIHPLHLRVKG